MVNNSKVDPIQEVVDAADQVSKSVSGILDIPISVQVVLASTRMPIQDILQLSQGSVVELNKLAGEPLDIFVNGKQIARGEAVVIDDKLGVRVLEIVSAPARVSSLSVSQ